MLKQSGGRYGSDGTGANSGTIPSKDEKKGSKLVHAMGTVIARTWYEEEAPVVLKQTERLRTGKEINDHSLILFSWKLDILQRKNKFRDYTVLESRKKLSLGEYGFPHRVVTVKYMEEKLIEAVINEEDAKAQPYKQLYKRYWRRYRTRQK